MSIPDSTTNSKICRSCGLGKPLTSEFWYRDNSKKDGFSRVCAACTIAKVKQWANNNKERRKRYLAQYYREHSDVIRQRSKDRRDSHKEEDRVYHARHYLNNREKKLRQNQEYRESHRDDDRRRARNWVKNNPDRRRQIANQYVKTAKGHATRLRRRARERNLPDTFTSTEWQFALQYFGHACAYCGSPERLTADHFIPLTSSECPGTVAINMIPACKSCNSSKQGNDPVSWLVERFGDYRAHEILAIIGAYSEYVI